MYDVGFRVYGLGFRIEDLKVQCFVLRVLRSSVYGAGPKGSWFLTGYTIQGPAFRVN